MAKVTSFYETDNSNDMFINNDRSLITLSKIIFLRKIFSNSAKVGDVLNMVWM